MFSNSRRLSLTALNTGKFFLTAINFSYLLRISLQRAGYDARLFSLHSFRRGGATFATQVGAKEDELMA